MLPTNLVTGFLGVGKTTAVIDLLHRKPPGSRWAVLVNEYGEVSIDGALIEGGAPDGVTVREVAGGCVCCASAPYLPVALHFLLLDAKPERLLIETSGLGHPAKLLDTLRANYRGRLDVRATVCLVDPADFAKPAMRENAVFLDQIHMADVVVMNKMDAAPPELVADFQAWTDVLYPPKVLVAGTTQGRLDPTWLDLSSDDERRAAYPEAHAGHPHDPAARGWTFPPDAVFREDDLLALLGSWPAFRLKGVFRVERDWLAVNRAGGAVTVKPTAYRRDSRLEVFADDPSWADFDRRLRACLVTAGSG